MTSSARIVVVAAIIFGQTSIASRASEPSGTCSMENVRMRARLAENLREPNPPQRFYVSNGGIVEAAEEAIVIKRRILKGELPGDPYVLRLGQSTWHRASAVTWFQDTPDLRLKVPALTVSQITPFLRGCWISDDIYAPDGTRRRLQLELYARGIFFAFQTLVDATGQEKIDIRTKVARDWSITVEERAIRIELPDTPFLHSEPGFPLRIVSGNEIRLDLPDARDLPFRRM